jgi:5-methylcytosine-specific restriction enzyme B
MAHELAEEYSNDCHEVLRRLARSHNVLVSGAPGTGKSKLLAEVARAFGAGLARVPAGAKPVHNPAGSVPIPPFSGGVAASVEKGYPAPGKTDRQVFRTVFHQNSKNRDFISGIAPTVQRTEGQADFRVVRGTLYRASEHAKTKQGASLLIIDEINRGPAVQVFGGSIVAIEHDKRLAANGTAGADTQFFEILDPITGEIREYALPNDLFILAAMNQADASIEPLDVAFLRRWEPMRLRPDPEVLRRYYSLTLKARPLPEVPASAEDAFEAAVRAWEAVNTQISLGRGPEFQIGHGVLMSDAKPSAMSLEEALSFLCIGWTKIRAHIEEVFFGDARGIAATLNALDGPNFNPFKLIETTFADDLRFILEGPHNFSALTVYPALRAIARV